jgi:hypothetical protein
MPENEKIIQIMPAPQNLYLEYRNNDYPDDPIVNQPVCLALTDQGEILLMDIDDTGFVDRADSASNFKGIFWWNR